MKIGILIATILVGILFLGSLGYFAYLSMKNQEMNNNVGNDVNAKYTDNTRTGDSDKTTEIVTNKENNQPKTYEIKISNFAFSPKVITIKKGDTIKWTNLDSVKHTVTSDSGDELDSELLARDGSYSHTFSQTGEFDYHCIPHSSMKAKVIVE